MLCESIRGAISTDSDRSVAHVIEQRAGLNGSRVEQFSIEGYQRSLQLLSERKQQGVDGVEQRFLLHDIRVHHILGGGSTDRHHR